MQRRDFLKQTAGTAILSASGSRRLIGGAVEQSKTTSSVTRSKDPAAIAMWDFSWLLRHYPGGEFEDWDAVLDGLVKRGYNAIRLDVFPALVAPGPEGRIIEEHDFPRSNWKPNPWGGQYSTSIRPRQGLKEFIPRCLDRGLRLGLSTWFFGKAAGQIEGPDNFIRVWDYTLTYLKENGLLHNIYYVDLLNEYPLFSGFTWLRKQMDGGLKARAEKKAKDEGEVYEWKENVPNYNDPASRAFYTSFANEAIARLQAKWPDLDFLFSLPSNKAADWRLMAPTSIAALDVHKWFVHNSLLSARDTGYWQHIHGIGENDLEFPKVQEGLSNNWAAHKPKLIEWMDQEMAEVAALGRQHGKPIGNTEGWGPITWIDHPALTWDLCKEAGEICAQLGRKHGYRFNCSSNFTHPQFPRLWADVAWHQRMTAIIRDA